MSKSKQSNILKDYENKTASELNLEIIKLRNKMFLGELKDVSLIRKLKKMIARKLTLASKNG